MTEEEQMDTAEQVSALNRALSLQYRSALQYTLTSGSLLGLEYQSLTSELAHFATAELEDARRLVEKVTAIGGLPTAQVVPLRHVADPERAIRALIEAEGEGLTALQDAIAPTGRDATSEAVEHRLEHMIMRKQEQVDKLIRATRGQEALGDARSVRRISARQPSV